MNFNFQLLLEMDLLLETLHLETLLEHQTIKLWHFVQDQTFQYFIDVALRVTKIHFMCTLEDNSIENVTFMVQLTLSLVTLLLFYKIVTFLLETLPRKPSRLPLRAEPIQTKTPGLLSTTLRSQPGRVLTRARPSLIWGGLGKNIRERSS